jgi:transposase
MRPKGSDEKLIERRREALSLLDAGLSINAVANRLGCYASSVMRWKNKRQSEGEKVYVVRKSTGRPPRLDPNHKIKLAKIIKKGAIASGYSTDLWTTARIAEVILKRFRVCYDRDHVGRLLHHMGFSCQKPDKRAMERNEKQIKKWIKKKEWPQVKKTLKTWVPTLSS